MLEVKYETLVEDVEPQARRIVSYCGLDWDPACLEFYKTSRPVHTAAWSRCVSRFTAVLSGGGVLMPACFGLCWRGWRASE